MSVIPISPFLKTDAKPYSRTTDLSFATRLVALGSLTCALTYGLMTISGQTALESARRAGIQANERTRAAHQAVAQLERRIDALTHSRTIESWAILHGYKHTFALNTNGKFAQR